MRETIHVEKRDEIGKIKNKELDKVDDIGHLVTSIISLRGSKSGSFGFLFIKRNNRKEGNGSVHISSTGYERMIIEWFYYHYYST